MYKFSKIIYIKKYSEYHTKDSVIILKINHAYLKIEISLTSYGVFVLIAKLKKSVIYFITMYLLVFFIIFAINDVFML